MNYLKNFLQTLIVYALFSISFPHILAAYTEANTYAINGDQDGDNDGDNIPNGEDNCPDQPNPGLNFDGINDYLSLPLNTFSRNQATVEYWFKTTEEDWGHKIHLYFGRNLGENGFGTGGTDLGVHTGVHNGDGRRQLYFSYQNGNGNAGLRRRSVGTTLLETNTWYHVAVSYTLSGDAIIYLNGEIEVTFNLSTAAFAAIPPNYVRFGRPGNRTRLFRGTVDELRIWNDVRTQEEIIANMNKELSGTEDNLTAYYPFNAGTPGANNSLITTVEDQSPNNYDAFLNNFAGTNGTSNWAIGAAVQFLDMDNNGVGDICEESECAKVDASTIALVSGATTIYTCVGDGLPDLLSFSTDTKATAKCAYIITDTDGNILGLPEGDSRDFEGAGVGTCLVWGLSYSGNITAQPGDNIHDVSLSSHCYQLSSNYITVNRTTDCVTGFTLVNADTDEDLTEIHHGDTIDISTFGVTNPNRLNVRANISGNTPGSVVFGFDEKTVFSIEQIEPFALGRDLNGDYHPTGSKFSLGTHTITATPYASYQGMGTQGASMTVDFTIVYNGAPEERSARTSSFKLYPNPANEYIHLEMFNPEKRRITVRVLDVIGNEIYLERFEIPSGKFRHQLQVGSLSKGIYIVEVNNGDTRESMRLLKK